MLMSANKSRYKIYVEGMGNNASTQWAAINATVDKGSTLIATHAKVKAKITIKYLVRMTSKEGREIFQSYSRQESSRK